MANVLKIKPYPIAVQMGLAAPFRNGDILKLTQTGFILKTAQSIFQVGESVVANFTIPVSHHPVAEPVQVVKTYDNLERRFDGTSARSYLVEFHFKDLQNANRLRIQQFLSSIRQA